VGENVEEVFGSYQRLLKLGSFRFEHPKQSREGGVEAGRASAPAR
jgi:hypothetical protein